MSDNAVIGCYEPCEYCCSKLPGKKCYGPGEKLEPLSLTGASYAPKSVPPPTYAGPVDLRGLGGTHAGPVLLRGLGDSHGGRKYMKAAVFELQMTAENVRWQRVKLAIVE